MEFLSQSVAGKSEECMAAVEDGELMSGSQAQVAPCTVQAALCIVQAAPVHSAHRVNSHWLGGACA